MKKALSFTLVLILILSAAACATPGTSTPPAGSTTAPQSGTQDTAPEKIDMRIIWWGSQTRHDRTMAVLELYTICSGALWNMMT